jgi:hypothetical protein
MSLSELQTTCGPHGPGLSGSKYLPTSSVSMCDPSWMIFGTIVVVGS